MLDLAYADSFDYALLFWDFMLVKFVLEKSVLFKELVY